MTRLFFTLFGFFCTLNAYAGEVVGGTIEQPYGTIDITGNGVSLIARMIKYGISIAGILGVIGITWGGIQMILSVGEDEKMKKSRNIVIYSIVGVIVAGVAYSIVNLIGNVKI